jgi:Transglutaminase-like superfamily
LSERRTSGRRVLKVRVADVRIALLACALAASAGGCSSGPVDPEDLDLIPFAGPVEGEAPWSYRLLVQARGLTPGLELPLPASDRFHSVRALAIEASPVEGYRLHAEDQGRWLEVLEGAEIALRIDVERPRQSGPLPSPSLPWRELSSDDPEQATTTLRGQDIPARLVHGLELAPEGRTKWRAWPEVRVDDEWLPLDLEARGLGLPEGRVRMGVHPPQGVEPTWTWAD